MKQLPVSERGVKLQNAITITPRPGYTLNMTLVYHDETSQAWAREVYQKVGKLVGRDSVRAMWWKIDDLACPGVLAGAVSTAMRANIIVAAVDSTQELPLPFHVWVNTWLPNRLHAAGCFIGLIGTPEKSRAGAKKTAEYLRATAQRGGFEFLIEERLQPAVPVQLPRTQPWKPAVNGNHSKTAPRAFKWKNAARVARNIFAPAVLTF
jgi:hypothetical protein